jgi:hypothetical protein
VSSLTKRNESGSHVRHEPAQIEKVVKTPQRNQVFTRADKGHAIFREAQQELAHVKMRYVGNGFVAQEVNKKLKGLLVNVFCPDAVVLDNHPLFPAFDEFLIEAGVRAHESPGLIMDFRPAGT